MNSGRTFLYYERDPRLGFLAGQGLLAGFTGETSKGRLVHTAFQKLECIPSAGELCFVLSHVTEGDPAAGGHVHELTLTNVLFPNTLPVQMPNPVSFEVTWGNQSVAVRLTPLHG